MKKLNSENLSLRQFFSKTGPLLALLLFFLPLNACGETAGSEFQVNTYMTGYQNESSVAIDDSGNFVVVWTDGYMGGQDGSGYGVFGQRYNPSGIAQGSEFQVNTYITNKQENPSVAMDSDGDFVVVWQSYDQDGSSWGVFGQRYDASGDPQGTEFPVNTYTTTYWQNNPSVAIDSGGDFVVAWQSYEITEGNDSIFARRFNADGTAKGTADRVETTPGYSQSYPSVTMDSGGNFVVVWQSNGQYGGDTQDDIVGQRFNASGQKVGSEPFWINTSMGNYEQKPSVAMDSGGDFVVAWQDSAQDGSYFGIFGQRYNSSGVAQGSEFPVNTYTTNGQYSPSVTIDSDGDFTVTWYGAGQDDGNGVFGRRYNSSGGAKGSEFQVNTYTTNSQSSPSVAMDSDGDFVVAWNGAGDGDSTGVFGQRFTFNAPTSPSIAINGAINDGGAASLTTQSTTLSLSAADVEGVTGYYVSESSTVPNVSDFIPVTSDTGYSGDVPFTLSNTYPSTKTVYAWFRDSEGDMTPSASDTIVLLENSGGPMGDEFQVNTHTTDYQNNPSVAMDSNGDFVVAWQSYDQDSSSSGVFGQRYDASGNPQGTEFQVNTDTTSNQRGPSVAMDSGGDFVVVWDGPGLGDTNRGIFGRQYYSNGSFKDTTEFQVNTYTTNQQYDPSVSMDSNGDFVVAWSGAGTGDDYGIFGQQFDSSGTKMGLEFPVNTYKTSSQYNPSVSMNSDGDFVVVWQDGAQDGNFNGIFGQRFNSSGTAQDSEFPVNTYTTNHQENPSVSMDSDGDFVVVWNGEGSGDDVGVLGRRYDATSDTWGSEFQVNTYTTNSQYYPSVSMDSNGDFVVTWESWNQDGNAMGVFGQRYDSSGTEMGSEFQVNTYAIGYQDGASVSMNANGDFVVAWQDMGGEMGDGQDGSGSGVFAQRFDFTAPSTAKVSGPGSTGSRSVSLTLNSTDTAGVTGYYLTESPATPDPGSGFTSFNPTTDYSTTVSFLVSAGNGLKTVYAWFKDAFGNMTSNLLSLTLSESVDGGGGAAGPSTPSSSGDAADSGGDDPVKDPDKYVEIEGGGGVVKKIPKPDTPGGTNGAPDPDTGAAFKDKAKGKRDIKVCGVDTDGKIIPDAIIYVDGKPAGTGCVVLNGTLSREQAYRVNFGYVDGHRFVCEACGYKNAKSGLRGRADGTKMLKKEELASGKGDDIIVEGSDSVIRITSSQKKILTVNGTYEKVTTGKKFLGTVDINPVNASGQSIHDVPVYLDGAFLATGPVSPKVSPGRHKLEFGYVKGLKAKGMKKSGTTFKVKRGKTKLVSKTFKAVKRDTKAPKTRVTLKKSKVTLKCRDRGKKSSGCDFTYYTTNGKRPSAKSSLYAVPITIKKRTKLLRYFSVDKAGNAEKPKKKKFSPGK